MHQIGIIEDDQNILTTLRLTLNAAGYKTHTYLSAELFFESREHFDLLIVDVNLPKMDGISLCKIVRNKSQLPIIVLTAKTDEDTAVMSLSSGANDFIRKPFGINELKIRIEKALQSSNKLRRTLNYHELEINPEKRTCEYKKSLIHFTATEFDILYYLASTNERAHSRESILSNLKDSTEIEDRTLDSHISRIRQKLRAVNANGVKIISIYGVGYKLVHENT